MTRATPLRSRFWTWILVVFLLALLVWWVGVARHPRPEIGVTGEESVPVKHPTPAGAQHAEGPRRPQGPPASTPGGGEDRSGDPTTLPVVPSSPATPR